jgi:hypothetical protein
MEDEIGRVLMLHGRPSGYIFLEPLLFISMSRNKPVKYGT